MCVHVHVCVCALVVTSGLTAAICIKILSYIEGVCDDKHFFCIIVHNKVSPET